MHNDREEGPGSARQTAVSGSITLLLPNNGKSQLQFEFSNLIQITVNDKGSFAIIKGSSVFCHGIREWRRPNVPNTTIRQI